jgi:membrane-bound serine protease (ClpP class)
LALVVGFVAYVLLDSPWGPIALAVGAVVEVGEAYAWTRYLRRFRVRTGVEGLVGERGEVITACDPRGQVRVRGELWAADSEPPAGVGESVRVSAVEGLTLRVEPEGESR